MIKTKLRVRVEGHGHDGASPAPAGAHRGGFGRGQRCQASPRRQHRRELNTGMIARPRDSPVLALALHCALLASA
eukprot:scaffold3551_cov118-Isochrysis_galbana.AAC.2